jgi:hypothetical protein
MTTADRINEHLAADAGNTVVVTTMTRATTYKHRNAGQFRMSATGNLQVMSGKTWLTLSHGDQLLVGVRYFREVK